MLLPVIPKKSSPASDKKESKINLPKQCLFYAALLKNKKITLWMIWYIWTMKGQSNVWNRIFEREIAFARGDMDESSQKPWEGGFQDVAAL